MKVCLFITLQFGYFAYDAVTVLWQNTVISVICQNIVTLSFIVIAVNFFFKIGSVHIVDCVW